MTRRPPVHSNSMEDFDAEDEFPDNGPSGPDRGMKTKRLLLDLQARWYWIALGLVLGILASAYYYSKAPKKYSATSTLLIKQHTSSVMMSRVEVEEIDMRSIEGLNTVAERIGRLDLLERVASRMDVRTLPGIIPAPVDWRPGWLAGWFDSDKPDQSQDKSAQNSPPDPSALAERLGLWMDVEIRRGTRLVDITFDHEVPEIAKALADAVAREYLAEIAGALTEGRSSKADTLLKQSEEARGKLQSAESAFASYNRAIELHIALESQENITSQLARRYLPKHPKMITATSQLNGLKSRFLEEFNIAVRSPADEAYWKTAGAEIEATKDDPEARLRVARQLLLARTGVLRGEITSQMSVFNTMLTRLEESNVNRQGEESNAEVSSLARAPRIPTSPKAKKVFALGGAGGIGLGLAFALLLIFIDNKYHSVAQIEAETGFPVLAAISDIDVRHLDQAVQAYFRKNTSEEPDPLQDTWDPRLVFRPGTSSTNFAEMFRILRASISLLGDESKRRITLFSSALPGEGKSLVSSNFALAAAAQGRRTLLIDLDLRKPNVHRVFGLIPSQHGPGVTEWLAGQASLEDVILRQIGSENLHIILSGKRAPNPGELLNAERLKQLFAEACKHYDLVVVDSAPLLAVPDTRMIAPLVDNFCLVTRAEYVPRGAVTRTLELLASAGSPPAGLVFNGFKEKRSRIGENYSYGNYRLNRFGRAYQYGYGSYGAYGAYGTDDVDSDEEAPNRKRKTKRKAKSPTVGG